MKSEQKLKHRVIASLLIALFVGYVGSTTFFVHEHKVGDVIVIHSHPFTSSSHSHSATALLTLSWISHFYSLSVLVSDGLNTILQLMYKMTLVEIQQLDYTLYFVLSLRAPPVL